MMAWIANMATACWFRTTCRDPLQLNYEEDFLVWSKDLQRHSCGDYSFAVCQANGVMEDFSQVETGSNAIFVGVYDGHGGHEAAEFVRDHLFNEIIEIAQNNGNVSEATMHAAIMRTENNFLQLVRDQQEDNPKIVCVGTTCLLGAVWKGTLLLANIGDARAVLGYLNGLNKISAEAMTQDHNVNNLEIRNELRLVHTDDPNLVIENNGVFRVKGILQVSRAIGDAYLKSNEFIPHPTLVDYHFAVPLQNQPAITPYPNLYKRNLDRRDKFMIFASDGLWDCLTNQKAVEIVHKYPRQGIARRLIKAAQVNAGQRAGLPSGAVHLVPSGNDRRRNIHDDITVVVVFIEHTLIGQKLEGAQSISIKGYDDDAGESGFASIDNLM